MNNKKIVTLMWPFQGLVVESLFRHYNGLAETAGYLENKSELIKNNNIQIEIHDCAVKKHSAKQFSQIVYKSNIIFLCVNMNNILDALTCVNFIKSIDENIPVVVYGEGVCSRPEFFENKHIFDFVIASGQYELGIEIILSRIFNLTQKNLHESLLIENAYYFEENILYLDKKTILPIKDWDVPLISKLPLDEYKKISDNELHITACKGCPYHCEFCNEKYVNGQTIQYRDIDQLINFMEDNKNNFNSIYLDASTFTYDRNWVIEFCDKLSKHKNILPWKTCTRLDCLDEELIIRMASANCKRISIGIESINQNTQLKNNKLIDFDKLFDLQKICKQYNIKIRLLLIIGLDNQKIEDIDRTIAVFSKHNFELRFRIYQDFHFLIKENIDEISKEKLYDIDRISYPSKLDHKHMNKYRQLEYPNSLSSKEN